MDTVGRGQQRPLRHAGAGVVLERSDGDSFQSAVQLVGHVIT